MALSATLLGTDSQYIAPNCVVTLAQALVEGDVIVCIGTTTSSVGGGWFLPSNTQLNMTSGAFSTPVGFVGGASFRVLAGGKAIGETIEMSTVGYSTLSVYLISGAPAWKMIGSGSPTWSNHTLLIGGSQYSFEVGVGSGSFSDTGGWNSGTNFSGTHSLGGGANEQDEVRTLWKEVNNPDSSDMSASRAGADASTRIVSTIIFGIRPLWDIPKVESLRVQMGQKVQVDLKEQRTDVSRNVSPSTTVGVLRLTRYKPVWPESPSNATHFITNYASIDSEVRSFSINKWGGEVELIYIKSNEDEGRGDVYRALSSLQGRTFGMATPIATGYDLCKQIVDTKGRRILFLFSYSALKWYVSVAKVDSSGATLSYSTPVEIASGASLRAVQPDALITGGVIEFIYGSGTSGGYSILRCSNLDDTGNGTWA